MGWSTVPIHLGGGFGLRAGHTQESTDECINEWNNRLTFSLSPKSIKKIRTLSVVKYEVDLLLV